MSIADYVTVRKAEDKRITDEAAAFNALAGFCVSSDSTVPVWMDCWERRTLGGKIKIVPPADTRLIHLGANGDAGSFWAVVENKEEHLIEVQRYNQWRRGITEVEPDAVPIGYLEKYLMAVAV
jgi:hypothetical protein